MSGSLEDIVLLQRRRWRVAVAPAWREMSWIISVERVSRAAREDNEVPENVETSCGDSGDEMVWIGESLLRI